MQSTEGFQEVVIGNDIQEPVKVASKQFYRIAQVVITDFKNKKRTVFSHNFEVEFDYIKNLDMVEDDDKGTVKIYGLKPETIISLQQGGGEISLWCGYDLAKPSFLFTAYIVRMYAEKESNTTVLTIECSANMLNYYFSGAITNITGGDGSDSMTPVALFQNLSNLLKTTDFLFKTANMPKDRLLEIKEYLNTYEIAINLVGDVNSVAEAVAEIFQAMLYIETVNNQKTLLIDFSDEGISNILKDIDEGYPKKSLAVGYQDKKDYFESTLVNNTVDNIALILDNKTGLLECKTEYKIASVYLDDTSLNDNESLTRKSQEQILRDKKQAEAKAIIDAVRIEKAKAKGKDYSPSTLAKKKYKVNRRYKRIKALINPTIVPQSQIAVKEEVGDKYSVVRVRNVRFKGNNKRGDWIMDLYCEDSDSSDLTPEMLDLLKYTNPDGTFTEDDEGLS